MFTLENTKLKKTLLGLIAASALLTSSFASEKVVDGAIKYEVKDGKYTSYHVNTQKVKNFNHFRTATKSELAVWNTDVMPDGTGLPEYDMKHGKPVLENGKAKKAEGSVELGIELYESQCTMCHGEFAAGGKGYPPLSIGEASTASLSKQLLNPADENPSPEGPSKVIGTYWPYASTLFWYIKDAMPFNHPKSLTNSEVYAITAYLLMENGIEIDGEELDEEYVLDREKFLKIKMPNEDGFYPNVNTKDPKQAVENMRAFLSDPKNYGTGTRCMKDCIKGKVPVLRIKNELSDFEPPASTERFWKLPEQKGSVADPKAKQAYETSCAACHGNKVIGAPVVGDKEAWASVLAKGKEAVYNNSIKGINAMPPKGGAMHLSDEEFKKVVDYMINASK
ncbi:c-type cytochrome [Arcobacter roscoffensis]|uniref:C-type cytochrome n=1 Tax=Arcobacter roscoffensis TaxID=2961520 RepID=A0ABY5E1E1_9BACT|nr:c-type cytochrome [Arcobacter roscoffensis]UTJ06019.1 c-type cytochrome [Arcobacter roscoffensis]